MIRAIIAAGLLLAGLADSLAQTPDIRAAKPLVDAWRKCAMDKTLVFIRSGETAETVAKVALYECRDDRAIVYEALSRADLLRASATIEKLEGDIKDYLVSLIVQGKSTKP